jgi:hypothetical protein
MVKIEITGVEGMPAVISIVTKDLESGLKKAYSDLVENKKTTETSESEGE